MTDVGRKAQSRIRLLLALCALAGGCRAAVTAPEAVKWEQGRWVKTELYFGLGRNGGGEIAEEEFRRFLAEMVTPRFTEGLTVLPARGQWRDATGRVIGEPSRVVIVVHAAGAEANRKLEEIRRSYRERFGQESVLRVDEGVRVGFD